MQHDQSKLFPFCCYCGLTALTFAPRVPCSPLQFHIYDDLQMCCSVPWARWGEQGVCKAGKRSMPGIAGSPYGWGSCRQDEGRKTADIPLSQRQPELSSQGIGTSTIPPAGTQKPTAKTVMQSLLCGSPSEPCWEFAALHAAPAWAPLLFLCLLAWVGRGKDHFRVFLKPHPKPGGLVAVICPYS